MQTRDLDWGGLPNLRDFGGVPLADGTETRYGVLFRSGRPDGVDAEGWARLVAGGIGTVIDLRNADEIAPLPRRPAGVMVVHRPIEDQSDEVFMAQWGQQLNSPRYYLTVLEKWPELVAGALMAIADADPSSATLIHCAAGRDRTGMMSAIILSGAGASRDAVLADYELGMRGFRREAVTLGILRETGVSDEEFEAAVVRHSGYLADFLGSADIQGMLEAGGAPGNTLERIAQRLRG